MSKLKLASKWWHRLVKVIIYLSTIFIFIFICINSWEGSEGLILLMLGALFYSLLLYLILSIFYYRVVLYIIYGKDKQPHSWSLKKIGIFVFLLFLLFSSIIITHEIIKSQEKNVSENQKTEKNNPIGKEIQIDSIEVREEGNEYCKTEIYYEGGCLGGAKISTEGKLIVVEISFKNISKQPISIAWGLGVLTDDQNRKFDEWDYEGYNLFSKEKIAPGFSDTRKGIYEVPKSSNPKKIKILFPQFKDKIIELENINTKNN